MTAVQRALMTAGAVLVLLAASTSDTQAYLKFGVTVGGRQVPLNWKSTPVPYFIRSFTPANLTVAQFQTALEHAFAAWEDVPSATVSYRFAGFTSNLPGEDDGRSTIGFLNEPDLDRVLAQTSFLIDDTTGEILESDIFFNTTVQWSTAASGDPLRWDLESIAVHEIGHFSGLGHSAIGETEVSGSGRRMISSGAVMFPIALSPGNVSLRALQPDDIAGISDLYPTEAVSRDLGSISGRVTSNGRGVFGAHVVAFNVGTGESVGNFSLSSDGRFSIAGLTPGRYAVRVEPLDDGDIESFFDSDLTVDLGFKAAYAEQLVTVPRGGDSGTVSISVPRK